MTKRHFDRICQAVWDFAEAHGMKPQRIMTKHLQLERIVIELKERYSSDPGVPDVDRIEWNSSHPSVISGLHNFYGLRGSWVEFICPQEEICTH